MCVLKMLRYFLTSDGESRSVKVAPSIPERVFIQRQRRGLRIYVCQWHTLLLLHRAWSIPCWQMVSLPLCSLDQLLIWTIYHLFTVSCYSTYLSLEYKVFWRNLVLSDMRNASQVDWLYWNPGGLWWFTTLVWSVSGHFTCMSHAKEILTATERLLPVLKHLYSICEMEVRLGHSHRKLLDLQIKKSCKSLGFCQHWCSLGIQTELYSCMLAPKSWWRSLGLHPI